MTYTVPVAVNKNVVVEGGFPLSEQEWLQFMAVLTAMKPALVSNPELDRDEEESAE